MLIYESRMYGKKDLVGGWGFCDSCGQYGKHSSYNSRRWGHLYFIPLIPMGSHVRVLKECSACSQGMHIPEQDTPALLDNIRRGTDIALTELVAGQKEFEDNGEMMPCGLCLAGSVEMLYCLCQHDYVRMILVALKEKGLAYEHHLVNGESLEFQGQLQEAASEYFKASQCEPKDVIPLMSLGRIHLKNNDHEGARPIFEKALELSEDRYSVLEALLSVYESLKDHVKLAETYEECFQIYPDLAQDKKVMKFYKKTCKKAGRQTVV